MAIESHVKRLHTDSYDHLVRRIRRCPIRIGILDIYIARKVIAPSQRVVPRGLTGQYISGYARKKTTPLIRNSCEQALEIIPINKRLNNYPPLKGVLSSIC